MLSFATVVELTAIAKSWKSIKNSAKTCWRSHIRRREIVKIILHERVKRVSRGGILRCLTVCKSMRLDGYLGTNCPYEEIFPKLRKNCCDHTWLVPLVVLSYSLIFLKEQAEIPPSLYP